MNDVALAAVIDADDTAARDSAIADVIPLRARRVIDRVLAPYRRSGFALSPHDADDIAASVSLRLVCKLRAVAETAGESIESFDDYVASLTFNTAYDFFRRRAPRRARLKNRLRYIVTRDARLALWGPPEASLAGLAGWRGRRDTADPNLLRTEATPPMPDANRPADGVCAIVALIGAPVRFDDLVRVVA